MPHIDLPEGVPGIRAGFAYRPETAEPLCRLAEILLRGESTLSRGERELIATAVSDGNGCFYCTTSHGVYAARQLDGGRSTVDATLADPATAPVSPKLRALLAIAEKVRVGGRQVTTGDVEAARRTGATDLEIHDTVLIAAAFCMYNRYVDGLATWAPTDRAVYEANADRLLADGYVAIPGPG
jgi:uncharacterized peroxidase-related enzyme